MEDAQMRRDLVQLLAGGQAHLSVEKALAGLPPELRAVRPAPGLHSVYEELEHMRLAQEDILQYAIDPAWESPVWPDGYWPADGYQPTDDEWDSTVRRFFEDLGKVIALTRDPGVDLTARIPHGQEHTYLREVLLVADHNAYHLGQIVQARKLLKAWPPQASVGSKQ
jgi:uncharacterized damage-inducible protein DinB